MDVDDVYLDTEWEQVGDRGCKPKEDGGLRKNCLSTNDWRYLLGGAYLEAHKDDGNLEYVLLSDSTDVDFGRDPFALMRGMDEIMGTKYLFLGDEWRPLNDMSPDPKKPFNRTGWDRILSNFKMCWKEFKTNETLSKQLFEYDHGRLYNPTIGGHVSVVLPFLQKLRKTFNEISGPGGANCNMVAVNRVAQEEYNDRIVSGYPFNGKFHHPDAKEV